MVFCWSLISSHCVCFNLQWGTLAASSLVSSLIGSSVSSLVGSLVSSSVSSLVSSLVGFSVSSLVSSFGLGYRYSFTTVVLKLVGLLGSCTLYVSPLILSDLNRLVYLPLCPVLPSYYMSTSKLRGRSWIIVTDRLFCQFNALLTYFFTLILTISSIAFFMAAACCVIDSASGSSLLI